MKIQENFNKNIALLLGNPMPKSIVVAVSGGPDSMFMCYLSQKFCVDHGIELHAVIVNHMLRKEASVEAKYVYEFLKNKGIKVTILEWIGEKPSSNIQGVARKERYRLILSYCKDNGIGHILTGHHADDQAETVFMRIMRGSGVDGISGIKESYIIEGVNIIRPMLFLTKKDIVLGIKDAGWDYVEDPSNKNERFSRVKVRNFLSEPQWEFMRSKLVLLGKNATRSRDYLEKQTNLFLDQAWEISDVGTCSIKLESYLSVHEEIALRSLCRILMYVGGSDVPTRLSQLEKIYNDLKYGVWKDRTLFGCLIRVKKKMLNIVREWECIPSLTDVLPDSEVLWDGRFIIKSNQRCYIKKMSVDDIKSSLDGYDFKHSFSYEVLKTLPFIFNKYGEIIAVPYLYQNCNSEVSISLAPLINST